MSKQKKILDNFTKDYHRNMQKYSMTYNAADDGIRDRHAERFPEHEIDLCGQELYLAEKELYDK